MEISVGQYMVSKVWYVLYCCCDTGAGGCWVAFRAPGVYPAPPWWLWARFSCGLFPLCQGAFLCCLCSVLQRDAVAALMLLVRWRLGLSGSVCCFASIAPVRVGCFLPCWLLADLLVVFQRDTVVGHA